VKIDVTDTTFSELVRRTHVERRPMVDIVAEAVQRHVDARPLSGDEVSASPNEKARSRLHRQQRRASYDGVCV